MKRLLGGPLRKMVVISPFKYCEAGRLASHFELLKNKGQTVNEVKIKYNPEGSYRLFSLRFEPTVDFPR